ncbi:lytic transglycosylase domain-containing protein [Roseicyclus sp. F158]|uniref:Lytic transglycosylase domain-containing protein n=1 Tax=Tropicimonas omnivorans TaxID=3075590 RepID=A0ABU3DLT4_9RHOB|nr:lytic transglycosylase domain-containing protein [Roseicyclus sp. F158]MDT0684671.1 lytic transglycosylase domain-containing protein [Roseicyclus sp. F158]
MATKLPALMLCTALTALSGVAGAQGVPVFDAQKNAQIQGIIERTELDLLLQQDVLDTAERLVEIKQEQLDALADIHSTATMGDTDVSGMVASLEDGSSDETASDELYSPVDTNPGAEQMFGAVEDEAGNSEPGTGGGEVEERFGDASGSVEGLIIRVAKETHGNAGVGTAGLSVVQWRALLQALIWQESRFTIGVTSPVGAFGLTQIMPGTASDLGINPEYYESPYLQVEGGARYLASMLNMFDGNIIHALAAYNAGPGNVQNYGGVPPFEETQHYVQVIPERYNHYLEIIGGVDALGTIDPVTLANSTMSMTAYGSGVYGDYSLTSVQAAAARVSAIIERIGETEDVQEAYALNTYARAELARLVAIRTRLKAAQTRALSAEQVAMAARAAQERAFMDFQMEDFE